MIKSTSRGVEKLDVCYDNRDWQAGEYNCLAHSTHRPTAAAGADAVMLLIHWARQSPHLGAGPDAVDPLDEINAARPVPSYDFHPHPVRWSPGCVVQSLSPVMQCRFNGGAICRSTLQLQVTPAQFRSFGVKTNSSTSSGRSVTGVTCSLKSGSRGGTAANYLICTHANEQESPANAKGSARQPWYIVRKSPNRPPFRIAQQYQLST